MSIKHTFVSGQADGPDEELLRPSDWNADHDVSLLAQVTFFLDNGADAITTGEKGWIRVPFAGVLVGWELTADASGSIVIDVWKSTYAGFPPVVGGSICGDDKPALSGAQTARNLTLDPGEWTIAVAAGSYLKIKVDSVATVKKVLLTLLLTRSE